MAFSKAHLDIITSLSSAVVLSLLLVEVIGIPLPMRDNIAFGVPRQDQGPVPRNVPYGLPDSHSRWRRHYEERPLMNQHHQEQPLPLRSDHQQRHSNNMPNDHVLRDPNQFGSVNYQNQPPSQKLQPPQASNFNNDHHRERRDVHYRVQMNDWQAQPEVPYPNSQNGFRDGHCTSADCMAKVASNNIRNENNNNPMSNKIPNVQPNPYGPNSGNNNKIQLPSVQLTPPLPEPQHQPQANPEYYYDQDQVQRNVREFYGPQYGYYPVEPQNSLNIVNDGPITPTASTEGHGQFGRDITSNTSTETTILTIRASSIAVGNTFEIVRIEVDVSEGDNEETNLEVEDQ